jgi:ParB-like chromosome segregation protein Spo0J
VIAGSRRLAALNKLAKEKVIPKTFGVPCRVVDGEAGTETSLAENVIRTNMHPAVSRRIPKAVSNTGHHDRNFIPKHDFAR